MTILTGICSDPPKLEMRIPEYKPLVPGLPSGAFHVYDYQFFFENLRQNVGDRVDAFLSSEDRIA